MNQHTPVEDYPCGSRLPPPGGAKQWCYTWCFALWRMVRPLVFLNQHTHTHTHTHTPCTVVYVQTLYCSRTFNCSDPILCFLSTSLNFSSNSDTTQQVKTNQNLSNVTDFVFVSSASPLFHKDFAWLPLYPPVTCVSMWTSPPMSNTVTYYETA